MFSFLVSIFSNPIPPVISTGGDYPKDKSDLVGQTFPDGINIPMDKVGSDMCLTVVSNNAEDNVTRVHSFVTKDKKKTFCIYDATHQKQLENQ